MRLRLMTTALSNEIGIIDRSRNLRINSTPHPDRKKRRLVAGAGNSERRSVPA